MFNLTNKTVLIFGGTGELLSNISITLHNYGAKVIVVGRNIKSNLKEYIDKKTIDFFKFDIKKDNLDDLFKMIYDSYNVSMIINGAGVNSATPFLEISEKEMYDIFDINYIFVVKCCQNYIKYCLEKKISGKILNIGSVSGINPLSKVFTYSASKSALHNLSKNLARDFGPNNICTNILVPGFFPAEQNKKILSEERKKNILNMTPLGRFGEPSDLDEIVSLLLSDHSKFINGAEIIVDGGYCVTKI